MDFNLFFTTFSFNLSFNLRVLWLVGSLLWHQQRSWMDRCFVALPRSQSRYNHQEWNRVQGSSSIDGLTKLLCKTHKVALFQIPRLKRFLYWFSWLFSVLFLFSFPLCRFLSAAQLFLKIFLFEILTKLEHQMEELEKPKPKTSCCKDVKA